MPFGKYRSFSQCVSMNKDKKNSSAYCATIMRAIEKPKKHFSKGAIEKARKKA